MWPRKCISNFKMKTNQLTLVRQLHWRSGVTVAFGCSVNATLINAALTSVCTSITPSPEILRISMPITPPAKRNVVELERGVCAIVLRNM